MPLPAVHEAAPMTWLEQLPPGQRLLVAAILLAALISAGIGFVAIVKGVIDLVVDARKLSARRRDARRRAAEPRVWPR
jgi:hypothetical protein